MNARTLFLCVLVAFIAVGSVCGQTAFSGAAQMGALPLQSNLGALSQGVLPQAPGPLGGFGQGGLPQAPDAPQGSAFSGLGGLGAMLGNTGGSVPQVANPLQGSGFSGLGATPGSIPQAAPLGGLPGAPSSGFQLPAGGLPTINLLGGMGAQGGQGGSSTPQHIQQLQAQASQSPTLDTICPGKQRSSTQVGEECWALIWAAGGCKASNVPKFEEWHQAQSLEVLVSDVVQWANLPDDRHKQGCYGSQGPPQNEPAPPQPTRGLGSPLGGSPLGQLPAGGSPLGGGMLSPPSLGAGAQQPSQEAPEVTQKIMGALQSPDIANVCPGLGRQATGVGEACWANIWRHVGCQASTTPSYEEWHNAQSFEVLVADAAQWASLPSASHRQRCYGANSEL